MRVTPEVIRYVKEKKNDYPSISNTRLAMRAGVSSATVGRILRGEYLIINGKVVRVKPPSPGQIALVLQMKKVLRVVMHEVAEICRENERRKEEAKKDELDALEEKFNSMGFFHLADEVCREKKRRNSLKEEN